MAEKIRFPCIIDTVLINGLYQEERRHRTERRKNKRNLIRYERRRLRDLRLSIYNSIDVIV